MTLKESLTNCRDHWQWLADNPDKCKFQYPPLANGTIKIAHNCFCCQYVVEQLSLPENDGKPDMSCSIFGNVTDNPWGQKLLELCPLKKLWPNGCCVIGSPFFKWGLGHMPEYAMQIVEACDKALQEI